MVPDLLLEDLAPRQPDAEEETAIASGESAVLGLGVHLEGRDGQAEEGGGRRGEGLVRVVRVEGLEEGGGGGESRDRERDAVMGRVSGVLVGRENGTS